MTLRRVAALAAGVTLGVLLWRLRPDDGGTEPVPRAEPESTTVTRLAWSSPAPPRSTLGRVAAYAWAAPLTAVGLVLGVLSGTTPRVHDGVLLFTDVGGLTRLMLRWRGFAAATLGHVIVADREPSERLLRHELVHVRQAERWGPLFAPLYVAALVRYGYRNNPFERAAYAAPPGVGDA